MNSYKAPVGEMQFALLDVLEAESQYAKLGIEHATRDIIEAVLEEGARFNEQVLAPLNMSGDEEGCGFDKATGQVTTPKGFKEAYTQFTDGGWPGLTAPETYGGQHLPESIGALIKEMIDAANLAWGNYPLLSHGATGAL